MTEGTDKKTQDENLERLDYPSTEDIYNQVPHISIDSEEAPEYLHDTSEEMENNLDIPGSELDNDQQFIGSEDEENNYWSLGGDNHDDLETPDDII